SWWWRSQRTLPEARADGLLEVAARDQVAFLVDGDGQLRQRTLGGAEHDGCLTCDVELRLVAGAQQVMGVLLIERDRAPDVRADLRVRDDPAEVPVFAAFRDLEVFRVEAHEQ